MTELISDQWGDPTPDEVYAVIGRHLVKAGAGDLEIYEAYFAVQAAFTKVYEMQQRMKGRA
jgi:hypothetical protein